MSSNPNLATDTSTFTPSVDRRSAIVGGIAAVSTVAVLTATASAAENPELENVRALLRAHDDAMKRQDLHGVLALMSDKAVIMGTGPGEVYSGRREISNAYKHFFLGFDKGEQEFDYHFKKGELEPGMGWLMASGNVKAKKDGKAYQFPINISLTVSNASGKWKIASMHFSTLTGPGSQS